MIQVDEKERIRIAHFLQGMSIREIARVMSHSRKTVRNALRDPSPPVYTRRNPRPEPIVGPVKEIINRWLEEDTTRPTKQRHTAHRIYERLRDEEAFAFSTSPTPRSQPLPRITRDLARPTILTANLQQVRAFDYQRVDDIEPTEHYVEEGPQYRVRVFPRYQTGDDTTKADSGCRAMSRCISCQCSTPPCTHNQYFQSTATPCRKSTLPLN